MLKQIKDKLNIEKTVVDIMLTISLILGIIAMANEATMSGYWVSGMLTGLLVWQIHSIVIGNKNGVF